MAHNPITQLTQQLFDFFTVAYSEGPLDLKKTPWPRYHQCGEIIRYNSENLAHMGDISVAACSKIWYKYCNKRGLLLRIDTDKLLEDEEAVVNLLGQGKNWRFPVAEVEKLCKERYVLRLQRLPLITYLLRSVLELGKRYGQHAKDEKSPTLCLMEDTGDTNDLRHYRAHLLHNILHNLLGYAKWRLVAPHEKPPITFCVTVQSACKSSQPDVLPAGQRKLQVRVVSGVVLEPHKKTSTTLSSSNYLALRSNDMLLVAMHRHGVRGSPKVQGTEALIQRLGLAAVTVDLFEVRHSSPATVVRSGLGSSKGAAYILYNSARLETLLRTFEEQVEAGVYDPLPPLEDIDLSVLEEELDWQLIYGYLLTFPELIESSLDQLQQGHCSVHLIVRYIVNLASLFSRYYRLKQILVQQRTQLMPALYARIYLLKAVREVLNAALALLDIKPVDYM